MKKRKWTIGEQAVFLKKTGELLARGYPLSDAIHSLTYQMKGKRKKEIYRSLEDLKEGYPFYKILDDLEFNKTLVGYVYYAEQHGSLAAAFLDGSNMMLKRDEDLQRLKKIALYPVFLMVLTLFLLLFVGKFLLPGYTSLYHSMDLSPNFFMRLIYRAGDVFPFLLFGLSLCFLILLGFYLFRYRSYSPVRKRSLLSTVPIAGAFSRLLTTHYFSIQLGYLLGGGLSIQEALRLFKEHNKEPLDSQIGKDMIERLMEGESLAEIVREYPFFEKELTFIIRHGQENGKLHQELNFYGRHCLNLLEEKIERMIKRLQPILYSVIGILIISMYLAVLLPMFQLLDGI